MFTLTTAMANGWRRLRGKMTGVERRLKRIKLSIEKTSGGNRESSYVIKEHLIDEGGGLRK